MGICVCNTPGINTTEVADHAMSMLLSLTRQVREQDALVKKGYWADKTELVTPFRSKLVRIAGNVVGIIGLGNIGKAFEASQTNIRKTMEKRWKRVRKYWKSIGFMLEKVCEKCWKMLEMLEKHRKYWKRVGQ